MRGLTPKEGVAVLAAAAGLALVAAVAYDLRRDYDVAVENARTRTQNLARMLEEHTRQSLRRVEFGLARAADEVRRSGDLDRADRAALRRRLGALVPEDDLIRVFLVADRAGEVILTTAAASAAPPTVAARDYFAAHRDRADLGMVVGAPVRGRSTDRWFLPCALRIARADGSFAGVLIAVLVPEYFQSFYDSIDVGANGFVTTFLRSGWIAVRSPDDDKVLSRQWHDSPMFREHLPLSPVNTVRQVVAFDGTERIYSYRALADYPVVVSAGMSLTDALAGWRARLWRAGLAFGAALALLIAGTLALTRQLGQREASEIVLRESEARLRLATSAANAGLWERDLRTKTLYLSPEYLRQIGRGADWFSGRYEDWQNLLHPDDRERAIALVKDCSLGRTAGYESEYRLRHQDGSYRTMLSRAVLLRDGAGVPARLIGAMIDITERKRAEEERLRLEREIVQAGELQQQRIGRDLHDGLGQQLTSIAFMAKVLEHKLRDDGGNSLEVKRIVEAVNQATATTRSLSKGLNPVDMAESGLMAALEQMATGVDNRTGVKCEFRSDEPVLVRDNAVAVHLYRIAQEAFNNALKHGRAKRIDIGLEDGAGGLCLSVSDDGVGFDAGDVRGSGGMGLAVMRYRADAIGATMEIRSRAPSGTVVSVTLAGAAGGRAARGHVRQ